LAAALPLIEASNGAIVMPEVVKMAATVETGGVTFGQREADRARQIEHRDDVGGECRGRANTAIWVAPTAVSAPSAKVPDK
jgi:hypothetical protein